MNTIKSWLTVVGLAAAFSPTAMAGTLTVNEGLATNGYIPFHFYYLDNANCRSQVIFPADQLQQMKGQAINEIKFYIDETGYSGSWKADEMILSMAETETTQFPGDPSLRYTDFITPDWTVCYSGAMEGEAGNRELVFKFSNPFNYTGSNLLIQISLGSAGNAYPTAKFLGVTTDNMPSAYTTSGSTVYGDTFLPQTTFNFGELEPYEAKLSADAVSFPTTLLGDEANASVKVSNSGANSFPVTIVSPEDKAFVVKSDVATLASGENTEIKISFKPDAAGEYASTLTLDLGEAGKFPISLTGKSIESPSGYSANFALPDKTLPESWTGWEVTKEYDYSVGDYADVVSQKESVAYFKSFEKDGKQGVTVDEGNHIRDYPKMTIVYMVSPEIEGNFVITATSTSSSSYSQPEMHLYSATKTADGSWNLSADELEYQWLSDPKTGWGIALGAVSGTGYVAVEAVNLAVGGFNADALAGTSEDAFLPSLSSETIDFGKLYAGESSEKKITLSNKGTKPFTAKYSITSPSVDASGIESSGSSESSGTPFSLAEETASVEPGLSTEINITFAPQAAGEYSALLSISFEEGESLTVSLSGSAEAKIVEIPVGTEFKSGDIDYVVTSAGEVNVAGIASGIEECTVPVQVTHPDGETFDVVGIAREAFYWSSVKKVVLPEGLRTIGYGAFRQSSLADINLPSTLTEIGDYAFRTTNLTSIEIPEGITTLGSSVFAMCEKLSEVSLPSSLTSLGSGVFYKAAISSIDIPENCTEIAEEAFEACPSLKNVNLPSALTEIKAMTFMDCRNLTSINLPAALVKIGTQAFVNTGLKSIHLPANVENIASNSFTDSPIAAISVDNTNTAFKTLDGVLYSKDGNFLYLYPRNEATDYTVADGTRGIIGGAFYKSSLKTVTLPQSLVGIDEMAFCYSALEQISIPESVSVIFGQAFAGTQLAELTLPASVTKMEEALVAGCEKLTTVTLPSGLKDIANRAFYNCTALETIICNGETPSEFDGWEGLTDPFRGVDKTKVTIYCPDNSVADYKASEWGDFFDNIKGISEMGSGIDGMEASDVSYIILGNDDNIRIPVPADAEIKVFDLTGKLVIEMNPGMVNTGGEIRIENLNPGIYIVNAGNLAVKAQLK